MYLVLGVRGTVKKKKENQVATRWYAFGMDVPKLASQIYKQNVQVFQVLLKNANLCKGFIGHNCRSQILIYNLQKSIWQKSKRTESYETITK